MDHTNLIKYSKTISYNHNIFSLRVRGRKGDWKRERERGERERERGRERGRYLLANLLVHFYVGQLFVGILVHRKKKGALEEDYN